MALYRWDVAQASYVNLVNGSVVTPAAVLPTGPNIIPYSSLTGSSMSARVESAGSGKKVAFGAGMFAFSDFNDDTDSYGLRVLVANGILGSGRAWTTLQMTPSSSTQAGRVPASNPPASNGQTNPLKLVRVGWEGNTAPVEAGGFSLLATEQGHLYNGFEFYRVLPGSHLHDVLIKGVPGDMSREPGETFPLTFYRTIGTAAAPILIERVELDGRNAAGVPVAASGVGVNFGEHVRFVDVDSHHTGFGHAFAIYESSDLAFVKTKATDTAANGFNFENTSGTVILDRCTTVRNGDHHIGIFTNTGTATYTITDPIYDGPRLKIRCTGYNGGPRTQDQAAIKLFVGGVERPDLIEWKLT